mgnify:CR=1 FL=1
MSKPLKNIIHCLIPEQHRWKFEIFKAWDSIIGHLKHKVTIEKIDGETLYLCASHPVWAQELLLLSPLLKEKINACLPANTIKTIRIGSQKTKQSFSKKELNNNKQTTPNTTPKTVFLTPQEKLLLAPLASGELQSSIGNYLIRCKKTIKKER